MSLILPEQYGINHNRRGPYRSYNGEIEFVVFDRNGAVVDKAREHNVVKIFSKEIISHRIAHSKIWDPNTTAGGSWVSSGIDEDNDLSLKYILFGASFDDDGVPLDTTDTRFYTYDSVTGSYIPKTLGVGAGYGGELINAIPISEPYRALKRIERIYFEPSYQPAGTPLLQDDVRAMNNVLVLETTLRKDEYNGFGLTNSDYFTITEVALAAGKELDATGACECTPADLFLEGAGSSPIRVTASGTSTLAINPADVAYVDTIKEGDQVKVVALDDTASLDQVTPYYLVVTKAAGGSDITLDRTPVDSSGTALVGSYGVYRSSLRIFSHRILSKPYLKSSDFSILVRWLITIN